MMQLIEILALSDFRRQVSIRIKRGPAMLANFGRDAVRDLCPDWC
ncbi:hypothetical protein [Oxalobacter aliiformigenes]|nr:hypothetical protein [Oxalobacter aliiformigenes]